MSQSRMRSFTVDGIQYSFNSRAFRSFIDHYAEEKGVSKGQIAKELEKQLKVSIDAVNNWKYGKNGPSDLERIKEI